MADKIKLLVIYEILGKPPEHIKESLGDLIEQIGKNSGVNIISKKIHEPHPVEKEKLEKLNQEECELFSSFAEVELEADGLNLVFSLVFNTLPSNIEVLEPAELRLKNFDLTQALAQLSIKLHQFDEVAKTLSLERSQMINVIKQLDEKLGGGYVKYGDPNYPESMKRLCDRDKEEKEVEKKKEKDIGNVKSDKESESASEGSKDDNIAEDTKNKKETNK